MDEAAKEYVTNIHLTEDYQRFGAYWNNYAYAEVLGRADELYPNYNLAEIRSEFVDEVPQTPAEEAADEANREEKVEEASEAPATEATTTEAPSSWLLPN